MSLVFDVNAKAFARDVDAAIEDRCYRRGELFVELANHTIPSGSRILDYGCGPGRISLLLAQSGFDVLGVDPSEEMIQQAKEQNSRGLTVQFRVGDEGVLKQDIYDAIVCSSVIEYVRDPDELLRFFRDILREAGILVISYSNSWSPHHLRDELIGSKSAFAKEHQRSWNWRAFRELLNRNGFRSITGPRFFDFHWRIDRFVSRVPLGILGIVAARRKRAQ
jgi:2-polyprenyl-3-methyl-5-hydroxy-6-metoxy-1,4-benzoquinol methylase